MFGPLLTDLYQLTMLQAYFDRGMNQSASFERDLARRQVAARPESLRGLEHGAPYAVEVSAPLPAMANQVDQRTLEVAGTAAPGRV